MEICGGARVDWEAENSAAGAEGCDSAMRAFRFWGEDPAIRDCKFAHCAVVTARQQS